MFKKYVVSVKQRSAKKIRLTEAGSFSGGIAGGAVGAKLGASAALAVCGVFSVVSAGVGVPVCGLVLVGGGSLVGGMAGGVAGEAVGEVIHDQYYD